MWRKRTSPTYIIFYAFSIFVACCAILGVILFIYMMIYYFSGAEIVRPIP